MAPHLKNHCNTVQLAYIIPHTFHVFSCFQMGSHLRDHSQLLQKSLLSRKMFLTIINNSFHTRMKTNTFGGQEHFSAQKWFFHKCHSVDFVCVLSIKWRSYTIYVPLRRIRHRIPNVSKATARMMSLARWSTNISMGTNIQGPGKVGPSLRPSLVYASVRSAESIPCWPVCTNRPSLCWWSLIVASGTSTCLCSFAKNVGRNIYPSFRFRRTGQTTPSSRRLISSVPAPSRYPPNRATCNTSSCFDWCTCGQWKRSS